MKFHERLVELRKAKALDQVELAKAAGLGLGTLRHLEQGNRLPTFPTLQKLSFVLGIDLGGWEGLEVELPAKRIPAKTVKKKS
ncbi:helix-turn-helix domain-containing protein [Zavarzinella formosa]|uniref:helix-turn-helix domain-containing protein n=1 Tax=Zavarzinella formosa TaxID=360055 RepID=UPI00031A9BC6|nr:helix-turn-helix transcriptional regulator [Zavarzinella formosa]